jgi:UDP:flavonoid glycosyltransferase YjiC (YdhE family)
LSRGLPLVLVPQGVDQFLNARQVADAHAGIVLLPDQATPVAIGSALQRALTDLSLRAAAQHVADEIEAMDSPADVIDKPGPAIRPAKAHDCPAASPADGGYSG